MRKFFAVLLSMFIATCAFATELDYPMSPENRMGLSDTPETPIESTAKTVQEVKAVSDKKIDNSLTYADLSLKKIADDILYDLELEEDVVLSDLETLWHGVASKSETVRYAIYKLSNPDENKPNDTMLKKIIKPIASFSTIAGTAFSSNPYLASGALAGGSLINALSQNPNEANYKFTKVTDTAMVLLVRKIDALQENLLISYFDYKKKEKTYNMQLDNLKKREQIFEASKNAPREEQIIADVYLRNAQNDLTSVSTELWSARQVLVQMAGEEAFNSICKKK
ncbi:hypothetical protein IKA15_00310 [bacterium]|nr:hypothetical protein [bacterium]